MNHSELVTVVKNFLEGEGYQVSLVPENSQLTPDLDATKGQDSYLIEIKVKGDDPAETTADLRILEQGRILSKSKAILPRNRLDGVISDAVAQIASFDPEHTKFHLIWIHCAGRYPEHMYEQLISTLLGSETFMSQHRRQLLHAIYYYESSFHKHRDRLDGAVLSRNSHDGIDMQMFINTLSSKAGTIRNSSFYSDLGRAAIDPDSPQLRESYLITDCETPRGNEDEILKYLREKYALFDLTKITLSLHSAEIAVLNPSLQTSHAR